MANKNLTNADLTNSNLTSATLNPGKTLAAANLTGVIWDNTTCQDGNNSDSNPSCGFLTIRMLNFCPDMRGILLHFQIIASIQYDEETSPSHY
ncbi:MAG: hypothetical protein AB8B36_13180 [Prochlorococcus sp.]